MRKVEGNEGIWMKLIEHLMSKEAQLRTEKEQYMKEKEQLRKEKEQLRKEKQQLRDELHLRMQCKLSYVVIIIYYWLASYPGS